jgi:hypothetical protein
MLSSATATTTTIAASDVTLDPAPSRMAPPTT